MVFTIFNLLKLLHIFSGYLTSSESGYFVGRCQKRAFVGAEVTVKFEQQRNPMAIKRISVGMVQVTLAAASSCELTYPRCRIDRTSAEIAGRKPSR